MNLAENRETKILLIVFEVMFKNNRLHAEHDPAYSATCYLLLISTRNQS